MTAGRARPEPDWGAGALWLAIGLVVGTAVWLLAPFAPPSTNGDHPGSMANGALLCLAPIAAMYRAYRPVRSVRFAGAGLASDSDIGVVAVPGLWALFALVPATSLSWGTVRAVEGVVTLVVVSLSFAAVLEVQRRRRAPLERDAWTDREIDDLDVNPEAVAGAAIFAAGFAVAGLSGELTASDAANLAAASLGVGTLIAWVGAAVRLANRRWIPAYLWLPAFFATLHFALVPAGWAFIALVTACTVGVIEPKRRQRRRARALECADLVGPESVRARYPSLAPAAISDRECPSPVVTHGPTTQPGSVLRVATRSGLLAPVWIIVTWAVLAPLATLVAAEYGAPWFAAIVPFVVGMGCALAAYRRAIRPRSWWLTLTDTGFALTRGDESIHADLEDLQFGIRRWGPLKCISWAMHDQHGRVAATAYVGSAPRLCVRRFPFDDDGVWEDVRWTGDLDELPVALQAAKRLDSR